jgi:DNA-binding NtrC family response regulator
MKVLVVDDEPIVLKSCRMVLEAEGFEVMMAGSVQEALAAIEAHAPGLLLVDVKMPVLDGMYLMRQVREKRPGMPIIVMSGYSTRDTIREALELGAATFIAKPFTPDELTDTVRSVLKTRAKEEGHEDEKNSGH